MSLIEWNTEEPHNSRMVSSWGARYYSQTTTEEKRLVTKLLCDNDPQEDNIIGKIVWGHKREPGRVYFRRQWTVLTDFLRLESIEPSGRSIRTFDTPQGLRLKWSPDPRTSTVYLVDRSIRRYGRMDTVRGKGPVLSFSGPGDELDSAEKEYILLTLLLFRCLAAAT